MSVSAVQFPSSGAIAQSNDAKQILTYKNINFDDNSRVGMTPVRGSDGKITGYRVETVLTRKITKADERPGNEVQLECLELKLKRMFADVVQFAFPKASPSQYPEQFELFKHGKDFFLPCR